ncbi:MAG: type sorting protein, partial [Bacteroidota bacterium]|nr:type sorting protein [Bacteroidota bacterium]
SDADIRIYDLQGVIISTYKVASGESIFTIDDNRLRAGIYLVRITCGGVDLGFRKLIVAGN